MRRSSREEAREPEEGEQEEVREEAEDVEDINGNKVTLGTRGVGVERNGHSSTFTSPECSIARYAPWLVGDGEEEKEVGGEIVTMASRSYD